MAPISLARGIIEAVLIVIVLVSAVFCIRAINGGSLSNIGKNGASHVAGTIGVGIGAVVVAMVIRMIFAGGPLTAVKLGVVMLLVGGASGTASYLYTTGTTDPLGAVSTPPPGSTSAAADGGDGGEAGARRLRRIIWGTSFAVAVVVVVTPFLWRRRGWFLRRLRGDRFERIYGRLSRVPGVGSARAVLLRAQALRTSSARLARSIARVMPTVRNVATAAKATRAATRLDSVDAVSMGYTPEEIAKASAQVGKFEGNPVAVADEFGRGIPESAARYLTGKLRGATSDLDRRVLIAAASALTEAKSLPGARRRFAKRPFVQAARETEEGKRTVLQDEILKLDQAVSDALRAMGQDAQMTAQRADEGSPDEEQSGAAVEKAVEKVEELVAEEEQNTAVVGAGNEATKVGATRTENGTGVSRGGAAAGTARREQRPQVSQKTLDAIKEAAEKIEKTRGDTLEAEVKWARATFGGAMVSLGPSGALPEEAKERSNPAPERRTPWLDDNGTPIWLGPDGKVRGPKDLTDQDWAALGKDPDGPGRLAYSSAWQGQLIKDRKEKHDNDPEAQRVSAELFARWRGTGEKK